ncbi:MULTISPECIES: hypothetical protein [Halorussus]|uniref:hypothetical protein n=1 Tax=Halorussus TaxID=1070314 RepID=UPI0020A1C993|nr:hypothetical protein [Halorussus vallis]USZ78616.1 hypothetical protein NGM07_25035 [Halorussus vallis]
MDDRDGTADENTHSGYYETDPDNGRITTKYPDEAFIQAVEALEFASTGDVAREVGCDRTTALPRLEALADHGKLQKLESGSGFHWKSGVDE